MIFVDSCVLIDVIEDDPQWADGSQRQLEVAALNGKLVINAIIFAEVADGYRRIEAVNAMLGNVRIEWADLPPAASFLAAKAFQRYRARGGTRDNVARLFHRCACRSAGGAAADAGYVPLRRVFSGVTVDCSCWDIGLTHANARLVEPRPGRARAVHAREHTGCFNSAIV